MARGYGMALLAAISVAYLIHSSSAQTTFTVGGTTGWTVPQTGAAFYSTWAANNTIKVGDILVFNFAANIHDVVKVTKADYDACSASNPISSSFTPPVRITINASGDHYFFCSIGNHCSSGQKLMISASDASPSPAPQPSTPTPSSSPSPAPATSPASSPAPATSPPSSTPAPATSQASTPAPATSPVSTPPPAPAPGTSPPPPAPAPGTQPPPPAPAPGTQPPPPPTTAAPPPNSAASLGFAGFTTFLSIFVALCY